MAGCLLGGYLGGRCGPRRTIQLSCAVAGLGWAAIAAAPHTASLIIGRTGPASGVRDARQILILILTLVTKDPLKDPFNKVYLAALSDTTDRCWQDPLRGGRQLLHRQLLAAGVPVQVTRIAPDTSVDAAVLLAARCGCAACSWRCTG